MNQGVITSVVLHEFDCGEDLSPLRLIRDAKVVQLGFVEVVEILQLLKPIEHKHGEVFLQRK